MAYSYIQPTSSNTSKPYTKGGITYQKVNGKLVRVNSPKQISVAVGKTSSGQSVAIPVTKQNQAAINQIVDQNKRVEASKFFNDPSYNKQSIDPNKLRLRSVTPIINRRTGMVSGYYDTLNKRSVGFSGRGVSVQNVLSLESSRQSQLRQQAAYDYFINPSFNKQSIDPNKLGSLTTKAIVKNNLVYGFYDLDNKMSVGFNSPISKQDYYNFEARRQRVISSVPDTKTILTKTTTSKIESAINNASNKIEYYKTIMKSATRSVNNYDSLIRVKAGADLVITVFLKTLLESTQALNYLPQTFNVVFNNPAILKTIPGELKKEGKNYLNIIKTSPLEAIAIAGSNILLLKGSSKAIKELSKIPTNILTRLNPKFVGIARAGKDFVIKISKTQRVIVKVVAKMPKKTLKQQALLAGKNVTAISSQADALLKKLVSVKKVIRKPIPGEANFTKQTKDLLAKFDAGKLNRKQIIALDRRIKVVERKKGLLERSFFADPSGKIRPSRLGVPLGSDFDKFLDYFSRSVTFRKPKPQILLFTDLKVAKFPKYLSGIKKKLLANKKLTPGESAKLVDWQISGKKGEFKPVGFVSGESEITLPQGSIIARRRVVGYTLLKGRRIPIVEAYPVIPQGELERLLSSWRSGTLVGSDVRKLNTLLKKKTGFNYGLSYSPKVNARYVSIKRLLASGSAKSLPKHPIYSKGVSVGSRKSKPSRPSKPSKPSRPSKPSKPSRPSKPSKPSRPSKPSKPSRPSKPSKPSRPSRGGSSRSSSLSKISRSSPRTASKLNNIYQKSRMRKRTKFTKDEVKYMLSKVYQKGKYRPSLAALVFNITGFKAPTKLTGFEIRPIIKKK